jgi:V8-like Glu-specific endopeptidase
MPAVKKDSKKMELLRLQSGLAVDERKVKRKAEQAKLTKVLDKEITCGAPTMPACMPQSRHASQAGDGSDMEKANRAEPAQEAQPGAPNEDAAQRKSANASSFWGRWTAREESTVSLSTGKGNRVVPRSLRDAREDAVCKVESKGRSGSGFYTLVQGKLAILTNNHVLPDKKAASIAVATFHTANMGTVEVALYPQKLFHTSPKEELDYSLVACEVPQGIQPIELVSSALPDIQQGDTIIIVQHPEGGEKSASSGPVYKVHPPYVTYEADTEPGSSGSPVFKNYDPIALHHRAPRNEESQGLLGSLSCTVQRTKHSNKGIMLAAILTDLEAKLTNKQGKAGENKAASPANAKIDDKDTSKMAILERLRAGAASCVARKKADMGVEDDANEALATKSAGGWGGRCVACAERRVDYTHTPHTHTHTHTHTHHTHTPHTHTHTHTHTHKHTQGK